MSDHREDKPYGPLKARALVFVNFVQAILAALIFIFGCYIFVKIMIKERDHYEPVSELELSQMQAISGDISSFHDQCDCVITKLTRKTRYVNYIPELTWFVQTRPGRSLIKVYNFGGSIGRVNMFGELGVIKRWLSQEFPEGKFEAAHVVYSGTRYPYPSWAVVSISLAEGP